MSDPDLQLICEATGEPHRLIEDTEKWCLDCRRPIETCCEGEAGREAEDG